MMKVLLSKHLLSSLELPLQTVVPSESESVYWTSTEARDLAVPNVHELEAKVAVDNQINTLDEAGSTPLSYLNVDDVFGETDRDPTELLRDYQVWCI